ncbi:MAG TPA: chloride channel protein [Acidimicrobiales bacterium]|nr:chloride channel protein [Acidimicrobiales bacterium]
MTETKLEAAGDSPAAIRAAVSWLRASRLGLVAMALVVGAGAGLAAVGFRWLIFAFTWVATGRQQFGQQGRVASTHLPFLGIWFLLLVPVVGGLIYGPLIQRFAKEARGHGVPEVMLAVAENGGRIRPAVSVVKAVASALCIGVGGSVGREGPIVQIGSAFASTVGQGVRMSESRLRILVACGAAGGISATFNAPITGLFFGFEIILRELSLDALFAVILSSVAADLVSQAFFGSAPFFSNIPHDLLVRHDYTYLLVAVLGVAAGVIGFGFKTVLYRVEDLVDRLWNGRPEWARPAVGGVVLGAMLLALPQMYGVGYPVVDKAISGHTVLWLLAVLMVGKILAVSLTLSIGGSGGVFAPSLFTGAMAGMAFGVIVEHLFGPIVTSPAVFGVVAMGAVFGGAAQAPLTAIASVVEMTANFTLILPVMLAVGIAAAVSKRLSHGSIYTTKLLRLGVDIERPKPANVLQLLTVSDAMLPLPQHNGGLAGTTDDGAAPGSNMGPHSWAELIGPVSATRRPQAIFADESLDQALRQLVLYGRAGLPVLSPDGQHLRGWVTRHNVLRVLAERVSSTEREAESGRLAAEFSDDDAVSKVHAPRTPLDGYEIVELAVRHGSPGAGKRLGEVSWPAGSQVVAVTEHHELVTPRSDIQLRPGERVVLLVPIASDDPHL